MAQAILEYVLDQTQVFKFEQELEKLKKTTNELQSALNKFGNSTKKVSNQTKAATASTKKLKSEQGKLKDATKDTRKSVDDLSESLNTFDESLSVLSGGRMGGGIANLGRLATSLSRLATNPVTATASVIALPFTIAAAAAADYNEQLLKMVEYSKVYGTSANNMNALLTIAKRAKVDFQDLHGIIIPLSTDLREAFKLDDEEFSGALNKIGLETEKLLNMSAPEQLMAISKALNQSGLSQGEKFEVMSDIGIGEEDRKLLTQMANRSDEKIRAVSGETLDALEKEEQASKRLAKAWEEAGAIGSDMFSWVDEGQGLLMEAGSWFLESINKGNEKILQMTRDNGDTDLTGFILGNADKMISGLMMLILKSRS